MINKFIVILREATAIWYFWLDHNFGGCGHTKDLLIMSRQTHDLASLLSVAHQELVRGWLACS